MYPIDDPSRARPLDRRHRPGSLPLDHPARRRPDVVHHVHVDGHHPSGCCGARCRWCGPEADAWALGDAVMAAVRLVAAVLAVLARRPLVALAALLVAGAVAFGPW